MTNFELHLTTQNLTADQLTQFKAVCRTLKAKPLFIELARGEYCQQPMATAHIECALEEILTRAQALSRLFEQRGFPIERIKIEAPFDALPVSAQITEDSPRYLEWHGKVRLHSQPELVELCKKYGSHLSRNAIEGETGLRFVSIRLPLGDKAAFRRYVQSFVDELEANGWPLVKQQFEHGVYDSRVAFDNGWLSE